MSADAGLSVYASKRCTREAQGGTAHWAKILARGAKKENMNLGQGFPDHVPDSTLNVLQSGVSEALQENKFNQYSPQPGLLSLRTAIAELHQVFHSSSVNPENEVCVVPGGTAGIFAAIHATINPGDEVDQRRALS